MRHLDTPNSLFPHSPHKTTSNLQQLMLSDVACKQRLLVVSKPSDLRLLHFSTGQRQDPCLTNKRENQMVIIGILR